MQNFRAKPDTAMRTSADLGLEEYLATIAVARIVLGPRMRVRAKTWSTSPSAPPCSAPAWATGAGSPRSPPTT